MKTEAFKDWLKTVIDSPSYTIGKLDTSKSQTICIYSGLSAGFYKPAVGNASGYGEKTIRILVRWGQNFTKAEAKAQEVYDALSNVIKVGGVTTCIMRKHPEPVSLGTDDKGVYEFSIDITLYHER